MLDPKLPALILAPMEGITDAPMRAIQTATGHFTFAVSEFVRVSGQSLPAKVFRSWVPELATGCRTESGTPVQIQLLGGDPGRMAESAAVACRAGALGIDINFGCPAQTVNRHDGGATLLKYPERVQEIVAAIRSAVPKEIPVSAKLRLGWDDIDAVYENAAKAAEGGASWIAIHARTRTQGYAPPVFWPPIGRVARSLSIPVVANGDIWTLDDFRRCQDETGCIHYMIGRGALANPRLPFQIAAELGMKTNPDSVDLHWESLLRSLLDSMERFGPTRSSHGVKRLKQWLRLADHHGDFAHFDSIKRAESVEDLFCRLKQATQPLQLQVPAMACAQ